MDFLFSSVQLHYAINRHKIIALNDGSYILIADGKSTLHGEAYMIKDGKQWQICKDGEFLAL